MLIGAGVAVSLPLQECSVGELVGPWCPFSPGGAGRRSPGRAQLARADLWRLLAVLVVLIGAPVAVSILLQECGVGELVGPWRPFSPEGAGRGSPGRAQLAGASLRRLLAVLVVLIGAPVAVSIPLQESGVWLLDTSRSKERYRA